MTTIEEFSPTPVFLRASGVFDMEGTYGQEAYRLVKDGFQKGVATGGPGGVSTTLRSTVVGRATPTGRCS